jgi:hypothetical protein
LARAETAAALKSGSGFHARGRPAVHVARSCREYPQAEAHPAACWRFPLSGFGAHISKKGKIAYPEHTPLKNLQVTLLNKLGVQAKK